MKKRIILILLTFISVYLVSGETGFKNRPINDNILMETGYSLRKGEFELGLGNIDFGISDHIQLSTNVFYFLFQDFNLSLKYSLFKKKNNAFAIGIDYHDNLEHRFFSAFGIVSDEEFTAGKSISSFAAYSIKIGKRIKIHLEGRYRLIDLFSYEYEFDENDWDYYRQEIVKSTSKRFILSSGMEYTFSNKTLFLLESAYNFKLDRFRIGSAILFGWEKFKIKLGVNYLKNGAGKFTFPTIGLSWRFKG